MKLTALSHRQRRSGTAVIVVITILALLLVFIMGNIRTLDNLGKEIRLLDTRQRARIQMPVLNTQSTLPKAVPEIAPR